MGVLLDQVKEVIAQNQTVILLVVIAVIALAVLITAITYYCCIGKSVRGWAYVILPADVERALDSVISLIPKKERLDQNGQVLTVAPRFHLTFVRRLSERKQGRALARFKRVLRENQEFLPLVCAPLTAGIGRVERLQERIFALYLPVASDNLRELRLAMGDEFGSHLHYPQAGHITIAYLRDEWLFGDEHRASRLQLAVDKAIQGTDTIKIDDVMVKMGSAPATRVSLQPKTESKKKK